MKKDSWVTKTNYSRFRREEQDIKERICEIANRLTDLNMKYDLDVSYYEVNYFTVYDTHYKIISIDNIYKVVVSSSSSFDTSTFNEEFIWNEDAFLSYLSSLEEEWHRKVAEVSEKSQKAAQKKRKEEYAQYNKLKAQFSNLGEKECPVCGSHLESTHPYGWLGCKKCDFVDISRCF